MLNSYLHITKTDKLVTKKIDLDTILWIDGKKAGKLQARFEVIHEPFFEQKIAGVMTEDLLSSEKKSSTSFVYNDVFELVKAQSLFLDIGEQMWATYDRLEPFMDSSYYACLESLLKRGEFELSNLSLGPSLKPAVREPKVKIAFRYQRMLYEILNKVFDDCPLHQ